MACHRIGELLPIDSSCSVSFRNVMFIYKSENRQKPIGTALRLSRPSCFLCVMHECDKIFRAALVRAVIFGENYTRSSVCSPNPCHYPFPDGRIALLAKRKKARRMPLTTECATLLILVLALVLVLVVFNIICCHINRYKDR